MTKGQTITLIIVALVIFGGIVYFMNNPSALPNTPDMNNEMDENATTTEENQEPIGEEAAPGSSRITDEGSVVNDEGEQTRNDAEINDPDAPRQSEPLSADDVPSDAVSIEVSASGFSPSSFTVDSGDAITLSITSVDEQSHIFKFRDSSMQGVAVGLSPGETRSISFNAPSAGEYEFYCDVPGHSGRGETGIMTVN